jgi:uncharacterized surface protein with fasciclin (FAS1) repeats
MKPISFLAVAVVAAGAFIATAGDGTCPLSGKTAKAEGTCNLEGKAAKADASGTEAGFAVEEAGCSKVRAKWSSQDKLAELKAACDGGTCPTEAGLAKNEACEGGVCPLTGKQVAANEECEGGVCPSGTKDIVNTVLQDGSFSTLLLAARAAGVMDKLNCPEPKTLLAPTNEAFQKLPAEQWATLLQDDEALQAVLSRHIIDGAIPSADLAKEGAVCSSLGAKRCDVSGKTTIGTANVTRVDIAASNGIIHVIDQVLLPEAPAEVAAAESTEAVETVQVASAE